MTAAIRVENLGKKYRVVQGEPRAAYRTFREVLTGAALAPLRKLRGRSEEQKAAEEFWALKDVSFEVQPGEVVGIIGRNGAGKSTLLKVLSRITKPTTGRVDLNGRVGSLLEVGTGFHPELTGRENVYLNGSILGMSRKEIDRKFDEIVAFAEVEKFLDTPVKRYSSGMYVRLAFAVAAHLEPEILIVDEVLAVGDAQFQQKCLEKMRSLGSSGRTLLYVSHQLTTISRLCNRCILLSGGRVQLAGSPDAVISAYVGDSAATAEKTYDGGVVRAIRMMQVEATLRLEVEFEAPRPLAAVCLGFVVSDPNTTPLFSTNTRLSGLPEFGRDAESGTVTVTIHSPTLLDGTYFLSVWLGDGVTDYFEARHCLSFEVKDMTRTSYQPASTANGYIMPECRWELSEPACVASSEADSGRGAVNG